MSCYNPLPYVKFGSLTLKAPDFGDLDDIDYSRINIRSRANGIIIYRPDYWPKSEIYTLTFTGLTDDEKRSLESYYYSNLGKIIAYTDVEGNPHNGIITTPELEFVELNDCTWRVNLQFSVFGSI